MDVLCGATARKVGSTWLNRFPDYASCYASMLLGFAVPALGGIRGGRPHTGPCYLRSTDVGVIWLTARSSLSYDAGPKDNSFVGASFVAVASKCCVELQGFCLAGLVGRDGFFGRKKMCVWPMDRTGAKEGRRLLIRA